MASTKKPYRRKRTSVPNCPNIFRFDEWDTYQREKGKRCNCFCLGPRSSRNIFSLPDWIFFKF